MPHRIIRNWYTGRWSVGCYIWYSEEGPGRAAALSSPLLAVPNVTAHPSAASAPITVLLYDGPLRCGFNVAIKGLNSKTVFYFHRSILSTPDWLWTDLSILSAQTSDRKINSLTNGSTSTSITVSITELCYVMSSWELISWLFSNRHRGFPSICADYNTPQ